MKKSSSLVIIIPLVIALLVVGSVMVVKYFSPVPEESRAFQPAPTAASIPKLAVPSGKPETGFDKMQPTTPVSDLRQSYEGVTDSGATDFDALKEEASSL